MLWHALPGWLSLLTVDDGTRAMVVGRAVCLHIETTLGCEGESREERYRVGEIVARPPVWIALIKRIRTCMMLMCTYFVWLYGMHWHCCSWLSGDASTPRNGTCNHSGSKKRVPKHFCHIPPYDEVIVAKPRVRLDCSGLSALSQQKIGESARSTNKNRDKSCLLYIIYCSAVLNSLAWLLVWRGTELPCSLAVYMTLRNMRQS